MHPNAGPLIAGQWQFMASSYPQVRFIIHTRSQQDGFRIEKNENIVDNSVQNLISFQKYNQIVILSNWAKPFILLMKIVSLRRPIRIQKKIYEAYTNGGYP